MSLNKAKLIRPAYTGVGQEFSARCRELCERELPDAAWQPWKDLKLQDGQSFPLDATQDIKINFIDEHLFEVLLPEDMAFPNRNMLPHIRADLNKYRGWLLHRSLMQLKELGQSEKQKTDDKKVEAKTYSYILPEDYPKIAYDLWLYHKHINGNDGNIASCQSLDKLAELVKKYRPQYPISHKDRIEAHAHFLITDTPAQLEAFLPEGWSATKTTVTMPDGSKIKRMKGAKLIAQLSDGTEIIELLTEKASISYGSPRWCTAYRNRKTLFTSYAGDLLAMITPDGQRWQMQVKRNMFMDANDMKVELKTLAVEHPGIEEVLAAYHLKYNGLTEFLKNVQDPRLSTPQGFERFLAILEEKIIVMKPQEIRAALNRCLVSKEWESAMSARLPLLVGKALDEGNIAAGAAMMDSAYQNSGLWADALAPTIDRNLQKLTRIFSEMHRDPETQYTIYSLLSNSVVGDMPEWTPHITPGTYQKMKKYIQVRSLPKASPLVPL